MHGVAFLVAPYEADAQMAYLARSGQVQLVVTEDSDLLAYGCPRCAWDACLSGATPAATLLCWRPHNRLACTATCKRQQPELMADAKGSHAMH